MQLHWRRMTRGCYTTYSQYIAEIKCGSDGWWHVNIMPQAEKTSAMYWACRTKDKARNSVTGAFRRWSETDNYFNGYRGRIK